ncbi:hypothetical protein TSUD_251460 [Trifolium subterraneum]|uniref:Uncharacterized protein n=1 Tax=Trifolium subterraneum TaxID=3900 RepID=A0A2Z6M8C2_TRISU|nr:hypothetical protein TSUD_251460 [Trifolium subterraneum]
MELVGRSSPIFISHCLQERLGSGRHTFSEDVIVTWGSDDIEALCFAKRTIKDDTYHLVSTIKNDDFTNWELCLIIPLRLSHIANQHDFILVGRRNGVKSPQKQALENWTEYRDS